MDAGTLRCPGCGAPAGADLHRCAHCSARLATVACPSCFGMVFRGTRHCPHCGARAERAEPAAAEALSCPECRSALSALDVGDTRLAECATCSGVWLANDSLEALLAHRERQAAVLAAPGARRPAATHDARVRYRPCPACAALMNRVNFQRISGVIVDVCGAHGTWFDRDELRGVVEFVRGGGLDRARARERMALEEERRRLEAAREAAALGARPGVFAEAPERRGIDVAEVVDAVAGLFRRLG